MTVNENSWLALTPIAIREGPVKVALLIVAPPSTDTLVPGGGFTENLTGDPG